MSFVKILAPLTGTPHDEAVLAGAVAAALPFGAHVAALFVRPDPALGVPFYGDGVSGAVVQEVMDASRDAADKASQAARATLDKLAKATAIAVTDGCSKHDTPTVSFQEVLGPFADCVTRAARLSDLVVFAAPKEDERAGITEGIEATLLEARRPVLLCARAIPPGFADNIVIGWNASVQSAQAVTAALPLLKRAKRVEILSVEKDGPCVECGEIVEYLSLHGIAAGTREEKAGTRPIAELLLDGAVQSGAGLLVLGGYGHSRWRELFTGGITRYAITHADLPLFLVH
jgi:nucleotide-binding universal stress UspA family protein